MNERTGGSLTGITVKTKLVSLDKYPSETKTVTSMSPLKPVNGETLNWLSKTLALALPLTDTL